MARDLTYEEMVKLIDDYVGEKGSDGVIEVLSAVEESMYNVAEHLEANWQDYEGAKIWERFGKKVNRIIAEISEMFPYRGK